MSSRDVFNQEMLEQRCIFNDRSTEQATRNFNLGVTPVYEEVQRPVIKIGGFWTGLALGVIGFNIFSD